MQVGMDEARLREQALRGGFVIGLRVRREVRCIADTSAIAMTATWMHCEAFQVQEDLDLRLSQLDPKTFVTMDVRCTVVRRIDLQVEVGVQGRLFPFGDFKLWGRKRLERGAFERLEALAARHAEARVFSVIDALDAFGERIVDLRERSEAPMTCHKAHIAHQDL